MLRPPIRVLSLSIRSRDSHHLRFELLDYQLAHYKLGQESQECKSGGSRHLTRPGAASTHVGTP
jgi:hypothetical protein